MAAKNETEVVIGGKTLTLSGYESEEYLQKVATYINTKLSDFKKSDFFRRQTLDMQATMIELNIADDYFKAKKIADELESSIEERDKEIYDLKHDLVTSRLKYEDSDKKVKNLKQEIESLQKQIMRLETELASAKK